MPQSPLLTDQLQIEPGSGQTLLLNRDSATGSLKFLDAVITGGALLKDLVGVRNITGVYVVGRAGTGAPFITISSALAAIPNTSYSAASSLVLVFPGTYQENLTVTRDGVCIVGLGGVIVQNSGASDTLLVKASLSSVPQALLLKGLTLLNDQPSYACVRALGADSFASATVTVTAAPLVAGDTLVINGVTLTGLATARTPGSNNFNSTVSTPSSMAIEISAAINDPLNSFSSFVTATPSGTAILIEANVAGSAGNAYTLTTTSAGLSLSGASFTGGSSAGNSVGLEGILIQDCSLVASAAGGFNLYADTVNHISIEGGTFRGSSSTASVQALNCASLRLFGVEKSLDAEFSYDTSADRPSDLSCEYSLSGCGEVGDVLCDLLGAGSLSLLNCPQVGSVGVAGDQTLSVIRSSIGALTLNDTTAAVLSQSTRGSVFADPTTTLAETNASGSVFFAASASEGVSLDAPAPDADYTVLLDSGSTTEIFAVTSRTASGFTVDASSAASTTVRYTILRSV